MTTNLTRAASCSDDYDPDSMSVDKARKYIRDYLDPVQTREWLPLRSALGRVLAETILAPYDVPGHDNSAMDGYAFNADDLQPSGRTRLRIVGTAFAGNAYAGMVDKGECVRIMTGAVMPSGCDSVVMQERAEVENEAISFDPEVKRGQNLRRAGEDLRRGQTVFSAGHLLRPADLGLIASLGMGEVRVFRRLRVAFFSTGDELASIGQTLGPGQVYDSNRYTLHGMLARLGVEIIDMGVVRDDPVLLRIALAETAASADVILTSGGVSVGEADHMKPLLGELGQVVFWKIAMKPGRPLAFGRVGNAHYFGLPGNPVAVMVTFYQFVREALLILMGQPEPAAIPRLPAVCVAALKKVPGRTEFQRGTLFLDQDGAWKVRPIGNQSSGVLRSMSEANCFIVMAEGCGNVQAGEIVQVEVLDGIV
ncbi:molybdopterin molybdenumtransferase [mine drainage metagenome]|uniref:molybdopterin molybdotransferase n=1 Tax=mine drainage metagenome TaxID=410659 RepID=A0A1J5QJM4_9ZZZZ